MAKSKRGSNASPKPVKAKSKRANSGPRASKEFGNEIYVSDDWKKLKKKHPGGFQTTLVDLEKKEWDDGSSWYALLEGHDKLAKISRPSGGALAEAFGELMDTWKGKTVHVTPTNYNTGWGAVIDPIAEDEEESLVDDDPNLDDDDENLD